jgi:hypothetical protein
MNAKKSKAARTLMREVMDSRRGMTKAEEKLIAKYARSNKIAPEKVLAFLRGLHTVTPACLGCQCSHKPL